MSAFFAELLDFYRSASLRDLPEEAVRQAKRYVLDTVGCMLAAVEDCGAELAFIRDMGGGGPCGVPGTELRLSAPQAAFAGSVLASALEMDDATSVGASVHPGCCVIPAALAAAESCGASGEDLLLAVLFGYDLCNRVGLMVTEQVRRLGLFGPGLVAPSCAAAVTGYIMGLDGERMANAFSIALSLSPLCPFSAFTDGADSKKFYTGWGVYTGVLAAGMAARGFTGPAHILEGEKSLASLFVRSRGDDLPPGDMTYALAVAFKDYSACMSVHAAMTAIEQLLREERFRPEDILSAEIETYPYACDLSRLAETLTPVSARVSLPYAAAVMLTEGRLDPEAFTPDALRWERYLDLMARVQVRVGQEYGAGPFGKRGACVRLCLRDGREIANRVEAAKWGPSAPPDDGALAAKFERITKTTVTQERREAILGEISGLEARSSLQALLALLEQPGRHAGGKDVL